LRPSRSTPNPKPKWTLNARRERRIATRLVAGNATIRRAPPSATLSALARNARCSANKLSAPNALCTASNPNVQSAARRTCARRIRVPNARLCAPRLNATRLVSPRKPTVRRYVKRLHAAGRVLSRPLVRDPNVNSNVPNRPAMLRTNRNAANVRARMFASLRNTRATSRPTLRCNRLSWRLPATSLTPLRTELKSAARVPQRRNKAVIPSGIYGFYFSH